MASLVGAYCRLPRPEGPADPLSGIERGLAYGEKHHTADVVQPLIQTLHLGSEAIFFARDSTSHRAALLTLGLAGLEDQSRASSGPHCRCGGPLGNMDVHEMGLTRVLAYRCPVVVTRALQGRGRCNCEFGRDDRHCPSWPLCIVWQQGLAVIDAGPQQASASVRFT